MSDGFQKFTEREKKIKRQARWMRKHWLLRWLHNLIWGKN